MKLNIEITDVYHNLDNDPHEEITKACLEACKVIKSYCERGIKPCVGEEVCAITYDYVFIITKICYCDHKIMIETKL